VSLTKPTPQTNGDNATGPLYLVTQRPATGLLAGFWEFPSVDVPSEDKDGEEANNNKDDEAPTVQIPTYAARQALIDSYLQGLLPGGLKSSHQVRGLCFWRREQLLQSRTDVTRYPFEFRYKGVQKRCRNYKPLV
jgi:adenine-specific DNA glycosylase